MTRSQHQGLKILGVFAFVYLFLVSIKLMGVSFKLFGAGFAEQLISTCSNPFVGLFIGILATSVVQSSSMTTSIVVGFVGGGILPIEYAIPIIMGANIGTTVTNILVSFTFVTRREDFRRAFAAATVHDFFNLFTVLLFFPLELKFHVIQRIAVWLTRAFEGVGGVQFTSPLKAIVSPITSGIQYVFLDVAGFSDVLSGTLMLALALVTIVVSLIFIVKLMRVLVIGRAELFLHKYLFRNDFSAMMLGIGFTFCVQSSSITTSLAVPLVAAGILGFRRHYPYVLGSNIGTTVTAILASLATVTVVGGQANMSGVTTAFAHLVFNLCGIAVFYPLKRLPLRCADALADVAARSKLLAVGFVLGVFFVIPLLAIIFTR